MDIVVERARRTADGIVFVLSAGGPAVELHFAPRPEDDSRTDDEYEAACLREAALLVEAEAAAAQATVPEDVTLPVEGSTIRVEAERSIRAVEAVETLDELSD